eukprot:CAMPEP_0119049814 /NCGR_PEP_ID=MMETSP1177-20130426/66554_1 /TAXON_ID=2985 /ORGANISM="Ochromonas sp, Strain CCMP1899" /LENGTH=792 /DNA_ID=CAMNT_0007027501 /DNA_START=246 /DNA_END=2624 /DNA_ORIENTATION=-
MASQRGRETSVKPVNGSRFDHLYSDAMKRKTEGPKVVVDQRNTFTPQISPRARSTSRDRKPQDLVNSLHNASGAGRSNIKEPVKDTNSYKPTITKRASSQDRSSLTDTNERLYALKTKQEENSRQKRIEAELRAAQQCTFAPKISRSRSASREPPVSNKPNAVTDRLLKYGEDQKRKFEEQELEKDKKIAEMKHIPTITHSKLYPVSQQNGDLYTRLAQPVERADIAELIAEKEAELTFQPKIQSNHVSRENADAVDGESVHDRLFREALQKKQELEEEQRIAQAEDDRKYKFAPTLPLRVSISAEAAPESGSSPVPVYERLNNSKQFMQNILSQIKTDLELHECTFQPELTTRKGEIGNRRASEVPVHERLARDAIDIKKEAVKRHLEKLAQEMEGLTFKPNLPVHSSELNRRKISIDGGEFSEGVHERLNNANIRNNRGGGDDDGGDSVSVMSSSTVLTINRAAANAVVERMMAAAEKHKDDLRQWEEERAGEEMKGATFSPKTNSSKKYGKNGAEETASERIIRLSTSPMKNSPYKNSPTPSSPSTPRPLVRVRSYTDNPLVKTPLKTEPLKTSSKPTPRVSTGSTPRSTSSATSTPRSTPKATVTPRPVPVSTPKSTSTVSTPRSTASASSTPRSTSTSTPKPTTSSRRPSFTATTNPTITPRSAASSVIPPSRLSVTPKATPAPSTPRSTSTSTPTSTTSSRRPSLTPTVNPTTTPTSTTVGMKRRPSLAGKTNVDAPPAAPRDKIIKGGNHSDKIIAGDKSESSTGKDGSLIALEDQSTVKNEDPQ